MLLPRYIAFFYNYFCTPMYSLLPNANIGKNIGVKNNKPHAKPLPLPNTLARLINIKI